MPGVTENARSTLLWRRVRPVLRRPVMPLLVSSILLVGVGGRTGENAQAAISVPLAMGAPHAKAAPQAAPKPASVPLRQMTLTVPEVPQPLVGHRVSGLAYRVSGYSPGPVSFVPYQNNFFTEKVYPAQVDSKGVLITLRDGVRYYHPVAMLQYSLAELDKYFRTGKRSHLRNATVNANALIQRAVHYQGGTFFPYRFDFPLDTGGQQPITAPWWSAMAQGQSLTLFIRLYQTTRDTHWLTAADASFKTLSDRGPRTKDVPWTQYVDANHYLWFEEYAGNTEPLMVLNGDMFTIFGLWDYYNQTHDPKARELFDAAATTLREYLPGYRVPGGVSYYCLRAPFCQQPRWQNQKYHGIITRQLRVLSDMTGDKWFDQQADLFAHDFSD